jgi:hypothetical protein
MYRRIWRGALAILLANLVCYAPVAADSKPQENESAAKVKAAVKTEADSGSPVRVRLRDGTRLKGYVSEAHDEDFVIVDYESGTSTRLTYLQVKEVKRSKSRRGLTVESLGYIALFGLIIVTAIGYERK